MRSLADRLSLLQLAAPAASVTAVDDSSGEHLARARLDFISTTAVKYGYLDAPEPKGLPLRLYPADTLEQARIFYGSVARVERTLALRDHEWHLAPNFHFGFMSRGLCWSRSSLATDDYARYWIKRIDETRAINRAEWPRELDRLIADGIFSLRDRAQFDADFTNTKRPSAYPRPGLAATHCWTVHEAQDPEFPEQLRSALLEAIAAIGEPSAAVGSPRD